MSFDQDPNEQANISGADFAIMCDELTRLRKIEAAAKNLIAVKGRHHTEQAYKALVDALKEE